MAGPVLSARRLPGWPLRAVVLLLLLSGGAAALSGLKVDNAPEVYFPSDAPAVELEQELRRSFPDDEVLAVLIEGENLFSDSVLKAVGRASSRLDTSPLVDRVLSVTTLDHVQGTAESFSVTPLVDIEHLDRRTADERRRRVLTDRHAPGRVVAADASALALLVRQEPTATDRVALLETTRQVLREEGLMPRVTALAGPVALEAAIFRSMVQDTLVFLPLTVALGLGLIAWLYRRWIAVLATGLTLGAVVAPTLALYVVFARPYTLISAMVSPLMAALTVAFIIHLLNALVLEHRRGYRGACRLRAAVAHVRRPAFYTAVTTAAGLASLGLSPVPPVRDFGLFSAAGVLLLYAVVMHLVAPLLERFDDGDWRFSPGMHALDRSVRALARLGVQRAGWVVLAFGVGVAAGLPFALNVQAETDRYRFFAPDHPVNQANDRLEDKLAGVTGLQIVIDGPGRDSLKDPERLQAIQQLQDWLAKQPEVDLTNSMVDVLEDMNWAFHGENPSYRRLPQSRALISQYLFIYDGRDLYELVNRDFSRTLISLQLHVHTANAISAFMERARPRLQELFGTGMEARIAGMGRLFADQEDLLIAGQVRSLVGALGLIGISLLFLWRSLLTTALVMVPNVAPIFLIFTLMGGLGIWLDMATVLIASVAVGIAVDDTVHTYERYHRGRCRRLTAPAALLRSYQQAGRAAVATTVILSVQFLSLTGSPFVPTAEFGGLTAVGLIAALLFDLLLLPALVVLRDSGAARARLRSSVPRLGSRNTPR